MAKVEIILPLLKEIEKKFKGEAHGIIDLLETLEENPRKGKLLGSVGGVVVKELRYKSFRFYFIADGQKLRAVRKEDLEDLLIKFVRMSDKKEQRKTIEEIRRVLLKFGAGGF